MLNNYCVWNKILSREEENLSGLKSDEIQQKAGGMLDFTKATNLRKAFPLLPLAHFRVLQRENILL